MQAKPRLVACPTCKQLVEFSTANKFRPFCCERCQMVDLGEWASENYRIADKNLTDNLDDIGLENEID